MGSELLGVAPTRDERGNKTVLPRFGGASLYTLSLLDRMENNP